MVKQWEVTLPALTGEKPRRAFICLPEGYDAEPDRRYPVLYMFDGHNVFFDKDATFGKSWGMNDYMVRTRTPVIIAAVECNHEGNGRLREYSPFDTVGEALGKIEAQGNAYMEWLVGSFKPYIDRHFRTLPDRAHTMICGSSMGGLMSLYAVCRYNSVFGKAVSLSPSLWVDAKQSVSMLKNGKMRRDTAVYMAYGGQELTNHAENAMVLVAAAKVMQQKNIRFSFRMVPNAAHCEAAWEKQVPEFMKFLML